jgi:hypothetical protein
MDGGAPVVRDRGNPVGEAVVWYVHHRGSSIISCFVPADAVRSIRDSSSPEGAASSPRPEEWPRAAS